MKEAIRAVYRLDFDASVEIETKLNKVLKLKDFSIIQDYQSISKCLWLSESNFILDLYIPIIL